MRKLHKMLLTLAMAAAVSVVAPAAVSQRPESPRVAAGSALAAQAPHNPGADSTEPSHGALQTQAVALHQSSGGPRICGTQAGAQTAARRSAVSHAFSAAAALRAQLWRLGALTDHAHTPSGQVLADVPLNRGPTSLIR